MPFPLPPALEQLVERVGGRRRAAIAAVGLATVVLILGLSRWASVPAYLPIFSDLPLDAVSKITERLDENGIPYRLEQGGSELRVPADQLARARVLLAAEGLPVAGRPGLELFDQPSWGMTDFAQRINYRRALEGELERTIGRMSGVESAQVHLAMDETRSFQIDNRPKEASVVLRLSTGRAAGADVVRGIQHLVASSVDGLQTDNVTVVDDGGRLLSSPNEPGSAEALSSRQLSMQREVEDYLEAKAQQLVEQVVGPGGARVKVAAEINFDRVERTTQRVDPDAQVVTNEQKAQIIPGAEGGAGSNNSTTSYETTRSMENFTGATGNVRRLAVAVAVDERVVPVPGDSVAFQPRTPAELAQIETLVRNAVGIDQDRGDVVSVVSMRFSRPAVATEEAPGSAWALVARFRAELLSVLALLVAALVGMRVIRALRLPLPASGGAPAGQVTAGGAAPASLPGEGPTAGSLPRAAEPEPEELEVVIPRRSLSAANVRTRKEVAASVEEQPEVAARLVRAWLKEA